MMKTSRKLMKWYDSNRRDLPWRRTRDPYAVWVSEIILQQTRVDQGLAYYLRFLERFPGVRSLAEAGPDEVLRVWQGLGYYSRARNMQTAARQIMERFGGVFPGRHEEILALKGIGPYTAAAIASICFGEPVPVVDGNVLRFLSRLYGIKDPVEGSKGRNRVAALAASLMDPARPGDFNQAMMEFGALYCKPQNPDCGSCVFKKECVANLEGNVPSIPAKGSLKKTTNRYFHYLVVRSGKSKGDGVYLHKREGEDIWKGLYEFPLIETGKTVSAARLVGSEEWNRIFKSSGARFIRAGKTVKHVLSHRVIHARFYEVEVGKPLKEDFILVPEKQLSKYPLPRLIEKFFLNHEGTRAQ
jgi:A/G-specific adenine glycosylase